MNKRFGDEPENPYDPLQAAISEGRVWGKGASGKYHRTPVTVFGFCMFGVIFMVAGLAVGFSPFHSENIGIMDDFAFKIFFGLMGVGVFLLGCILFLKAFKK